MPTTVLEKHESYEVREYPRSKWVCAKDIIDIDHDPMINWRERFNNDPFKALADPVWKHHKDTEMHYQLLAYFFGMLLSRLQVHMVPSFII